MKAVKGEHTPPPEDELPVKRLKLKTPHDIFAAMGRFTRLFITGRFPESKYKALIFGLNAMLGAFKIMEVEKGVEKIPNPFGPIMKMLPDDHGEVCFND